MSESCDTNLKKVVTAPSLTSESIECSLAHLIGRMNNGDREAAGAFLARYGPMIRRRIRGRMKASLKRIADTGDILSTLGRRLDLYVLRGRFSCSSEQELWSLVNVIAERSTVEKARILNSINRLEREDGPLAAGVLGRIRDAERGQQGSLELAWDDLMEMIADPIDRSIAFHWSLGCSHEETAEIVGLSHAAVRKRWERVKTALRERLGVGTPEGAEG